MLVYDFEIIYKKVKHYILAYELSMNEEEIESSLCSISIPQSDSVEESRI
jgi:hypothetical protein